MPILQGRTRRYRKPVIIKYQILAALVGKDPASVSTVAWTVYQKYANGRPLYWQEKDGKQYGAQTQSFMWLLRSGEDGFLEIILYSYSLTRSGSHAKEFLEGCSGYLETDGCQGYNNLPDIKRCSCWAHVRRYFTDAIPKGKEYDYSLPAVQGVQFCSKLFDCERYSKAKNYTAEQRKQFRLEKEKPILEAFWNWLDQQRPNKGTRLAKAVNFHG